MGVNWLKELIQNWRQAKWYEILVFILFILWWTSENFMLAMLDQFFRENF